MIYGLVTPVRHGVNCNPGSLFIEHGLRWLLRQADPDARYVTVGLLSPDPAGWRLVRQTADVVILCGNPRFNAVEERQYCDWGIWQEILCTLDAGVPFIDAWAGAAHHFGDFTTDEMCAAIASRQKTKALLGYEARAVRAIARDRLAERLLCEAVETVCLPCCTWWAPRYWSVSPAEKRFHAITIRRMPGQSWLPNAIWTLHTALSAELPTRIVCHSERDYDWFTACQSRGAASPRNGAASPRNKPACRPTDQILCLPDPESLLRFYAGVDKLVSLRVHATIPALALGAKVCSLSTDSRTMTVDEFGIESVPFTEMARGLSALPVNACPQPPAAEESIRALQL